MAAAKIQASEEPYERRSPVDDSITWSGRWTSDQEIDAAVDRARSAFLNWSRTTLEQRIEFAEKVASFFQSHRDAIAKTITLETGKPLWESDLEVLSGIAKVGNAVDAIRKRRWSTTEGTGPSHSTIRYKPLGMMVVLGPYNLPMHLPGAHIIPALLAGNTVLFKPSEKTPAVGDWISKAWQAAELPSGVVEVVHGAAEQAKRVVAAPETAGVLFTGSYQAGKQIHQQLAGRPECLLALEMGGNNPFVVDRIQNRRAAIANIIQSAFITSGQRCTCARRLIVVDYPENRGFLEELSQSISKIQVGNPLSSTQPFMGTLVSSQMADSIIAAQNESMRRGAVVLHEAQIDGSCAALVTPSLLLLDKPDLDDVEHFGPLLKATLAEDLDEAVRQANQTRYGLAAGILTDDQSAYYHFVMNVRAGIINWNSPTTGASGKLPFGGVGSSGNHRPSGFFASDYCSYPVASIETNQLTSTVSLPPGLSEIF